MPYARYLTELVVREAYPALSEALRDDAALADVLTQIVNNSAAGRRLNACDRFQHVRNT